MDLPRTSDYRRIFLDGVALLDVRAPVEFSAGAFPGAINEPLLDDDERHQVGIRYKQAGPAAAVSLGEQLISGPCREARINAWRRFAEQHPNGMIYCFRGGQRSTISQRWLAERTGIALPLVEGGYKAMRRYLLERLATPSDAAAFVVVGGKTGVGKTRFLNRFHRFLDLEALANHRGSAFGRHVTRQPTQINFENALAIGLLKLQQPDAAPILLEDESRNIGSLHVPRELFDRFATAPLYILEASLDERIRMTRQEYVHDALIEHQHLLGTMEGFEAWRRYLVDSLDRIRRRLGGALHAELRARLDLAVERHRATGDESAHDAWITPLLRDYYDPMYEYQLQRNKPRVQGRGSATELKDVLRSLVEIDK